MPRPDGAKRILLPDRLRHLGPGKGLGIVKCQAGRDGGHRHGQTERDGTAGAGVAGFLNHKQRKGVKRSGMLSRIDSLQVAQS
jgi:hypothetical protein